MKGLSRGIGSLLLLGFASSVAANVFTIDFDTDGMGNPIVRGQIIDDEYANWGVTISAKDPGGGDRLAVAFDSGDAAAALAADDEDLLTPGSSGNEGAALHNILIIQESGGDGDSDGIIDVVPDDEGSNPAGSLFFEFDEPTPWVGFVLVDIEAPDEINAGGGTNGFFRGFSGGGVVGTVSFADFVTMGNSFFDPTVVYDDNSVNRISPIFASDFGVSGFDKVEFNFGGSGGVGEVTFAPEPATALFLGVAMLGVLAARRRLTNRP